MKYLWTEDSGAGLHYWQLVNEYLLQGSLLVESKGSNQALLDAVRELEPKDDDIFYIAFDIVYDNMDVMNKYLELQLLADSKPEHIVLLDVTCFEAIILMFKNLIEWTGTGRKDKIEMRKYILAALENHRIDIDRIKDKKTLQFLSGFKRYSTERVLKAITTELTDTDEWSVKGTNMGKCWYQDCCVLDEPEKNRCGLADNMAGLEKIMCLLTDLETQRIIERISL